MHPKHGLFILSELNEGGKKTLSSRLHGHRIMVEDILPKSIDQERFMNTIRPQIHQQPMNYIEPYKKINNEPSSSLHFRRIDQNKKQETLRHQILYKQAMNIPGSKQYREKDLSQMLQNYCVQADPYGHKDSHIRKQKANLKYTDLRSKPQKLQNIYQQIDLLDFDDISIDNKLLQILRKVRQNEEQARILNYIQQLYPNYNDQKLMNILYQSLETRY